MKILTSLAVIALAVTAASGAQAQEPASSAPPPSSAGASASAGASFSTAGVSADGDGYKSWLPWVIGGLGGAQIITGIVLVAAAPEMPDNCMKSTRTCTRLPGQSDASFSEDQEQAGEAQQMPALGAIAVASGAVFLAAGVAMYFWYKPSDSKSAGKPAVVPYAAPGGGGLAAFATF